MDLLGYQHYHSELHLDQLKSRRNTLSASAKPKTSVKPLPVWLCAEGVIHIFMFAYYDFSNNKMSLLIDSGLQSMRSLRNKRVSLGVARLNMLTALYMHNFCDQRRMWQCFQKNFAIFFEAQLLHCKPIVVSERVLKYKVCCHWRMYNYC